VDWQFNISLSWQLCCRVPRHLPRILFRLRYLLHFPIGYHSSTSCIHSALFLITLSFQQQYHTDERCRSTIENTHYNTLLRLFREVCGSASCQRRGEKAKTLVNSNLHLKSTCCFRFYRWRKSRKWRWFCWILLQSGPRDTSQRQMRSRLLVVEFVTRSVAILWCGSG
jgi:hypothetical protein